MIDSHKKISGSTLLASQFRLQESNEILDSDYVEAILAGDLAAYRVNNFLPKAECQKITHNFWNSSDKVARVGYGIDGVEGYFIGASHIEKTTQQYLNEVIHFQSALDNLFKNTVNPLDVFRHKIAQAWQDRIELRPAQCEEFCAGNSKAVYWNNPGYFILEPHDDLAQLRDPRQSNFEIQQISRVMAVNFYPQMTAESGQLQIWNIEPDEDARARLNLTYSGFPYPKELLTDFESLIIPIKVGDLCIINGNLIHAVLRGVQMLHKNRLLITCFMGLNANRELIWWT